MIEATHPELEVLAVKALGVAEDGTFAEGVDEGGAASPGCA